MASGWGFNTGQSRCFAYWQEFSKCYAQADFPSQCTIQADDYAECLHGFKKAARQRQIRAELIRQLKGNKEEREHAEAILANGPVAGVSLKSPPKESK